MKCTKVKFGTEADADFYIKKLDKTSNRRLKPVRSYLCPICCSWHMTSIKQNTNNEARLQLEVNKLKGKIEHFENMNRKHARDSKKLQEKLTKVTTDFELMKVCLTIIVMK